jgi:SAM-dependent methyltransferase
MQFYVGLNRRSGPRHTGGMRATVWKVKIWGNLKVLIRFVQRLRSYLKKNVGKQRDFQRARQTLLASASLSDNERILLSDISLRIRHRDWGYDAGRADQYLSVGLSAIRCIDMGLKELQREIATIRTVLDFPCGSGRVLRFLRVRFSGANIYGGELNKGALRFCQEHLGIQPVVSHVDFSKISLSKSFDLIWSGSLVTHLSESATRDVLRFFCRHLNQGGICVFTTHGKYPSLLMENKEWTYGLDDEHRRILIQQYRDCGYGYVEHKEMKGYGVSLSTPDKVRSLAAAVGAWKEVLYLERGWDNHQDVFIFTK